MSNMGFSMAKMGLAGNGYLGSIEAARTQDQARRRQLEDEAQGQAIGTLVGAGTRAVQGVYDERKGAFDQQHADAQRAYDTGTDGYKQTHTRPEYSALDDIADAFEGW